mgnify:CR=1 FL=1
MFSARHFASASSISCRNDTTPLCSCNIPNKSIFKLFLSDVGMLTSMYGRATKMQLLMNDQNINYGAIYENAVAQELKAHGFKLYYFTIIKFY